MSAASHDERARQLVAKADKKLKSWGLLGNKYEDAAEYLEQATSAFKLAKAWGEAAETFLKLSDVHLKLSSQYEAATTIAEAGNCYKKVSPPDALHCFERAADLYMQAGRLQMAARQLKEVGKACEQAGDKARAIQVYSQAADLFLGEEQPQEGYKCLLEVAQFQAETQQYVAAVGTFEQVAGFYLDNHLLKFSARGVLFSAGCCLLAAGDLSAARAALDRYREMDVKFESSREEELLEALVAAMEANDDAGFTDAVAQYDSMTRLDPWKTTILLQAKRRIQAGTAAALDEDDLT
ncbi:unnamed protein product [Pedinophyceae sp. YPF-701]|nr:unnamed protein product [Pedinophyceae sp. YPF-701]